MSARMLKVHSGPLKGEVIIPGDKSVSHRAVMFGAISEGTTRIENFLPGEDCLSTIDCFRKLGVEIDQAGSSVTVKGRGISGLKEPKDVLDVGNSGTTIRLMMGILAGLPMRTVLNGDASISRRPMTRVTLPLSMMGAQISGRENGEYTPLTVEGQNLHGMTYELPIASAQVKSAILLAGLLAKGETTVIEPVKSRDHTERMITHFGGVTVTNGRRITVKGGQILKGRDVLVPGDISSAAFFLVAGAIVPGSDIVLKNVGLNPTRTGIIDVLKAMGADITIIESGTEKNSEPSGDIRIKHSSLKGIEIHGEMIPRLIDEIPIIALLASQAKGKTVIRDAAELKVKETNRIDTVVTQLRKLGVKISATDDGMVIEGSSVIHGGTVSAHGDHRIGMMLSIAALLSDEEIELVESESISVSYPNFFADLQKLI